MKRARVVVAGQLPPPVGGQNMMILRELEMFRNDDSFIVEHLPFNFTRSWEQASQPTAAKAWELVRVLGRLAVLRLRGRIDVLIYPIGGPRRSALLRDVVLLPFCQLLTSRTIVHIHAGGVAEAMQSLPSVIRAVVHEVYRRCSVALALTEFGRVDAESLGVRNVQVVPNTLPDAFRSDLVRRGRAGSARLLYVGHLGNPKGTPTLLKAVSSARRTHDEVRLVLVGEPLRPYTADELSTSIHELGLEEVVEVRGVLDGEDKWRCYGEADLFVFPSVAPESFPLVLLEAMMWSLPIVATDWRAHGEILGNRPGGICFDPGPDQVANLTTALDEALSQRSALARLGSA